MSELQEPSPPQAGGGSSLGCWPRVPLSHFSIPKRFLEANVVRGLAAMLLASVRRDLDVFNWLLCCRGQTSVDVFRLAAESVDCMASCCLEYQPWPRTKSVPQEVTSSPWAGCAPCHVPANLHPAPVVLYCWHEFQGIALDLGLGYFGVLFLKCC